MTNKINIVELNLSALDNELHRLSCAGVKPNYIIMNVDTLEAIKDKPPTAEKLLYLKYAEGCRYRGISLAVSMELAFGEIDII